MPEPIRCPACEKPVDTLRAGEVAVVGVGFFYFCDRECKAEFYARDAASRVRSDVATAEPPLVSATTPPDEWRKDAGKRDLEEPPPPAVRPPAMEPKLESIGAPSDESSMSGQEDNVTRDDVDTFDPEPPPPSALELVAGMDAPVDPRPAPSLLRVPSLLGGASAALAIGLPLVGGAESRTRAVLAIVGAGLAAVRTLGAPGDLAREGVIATAGLGAAVASLAVAIASHAPTTSALVTSTATAALVVLGVQEVLDRTREGTAILRARIAAHLRAPALVVAPEGPREVAADDVRPGDVVALEAGALAPVDAVVVRGESVVVPWPDAPVEVVKRERASIAAGAMVVRGAIEVEATATADMRAFYKLSIARATRVDREASLVRVARRGGLAGSLLFSCLAGVGGFAAGASATHAVGVVAAALCGFAVDGVVAAAATALGRGHLRAQRSGATYRSADAFERAANVDLAVACARGTLLLGEPEVVFVDALGNWTQEGVLGTAAGLFSGSAHPYSAALQRAAKARGARPESVRNPLQDGAGVVALGASGESLALGRRAFLIDQRVGVGAVDARVDDLEGQGRSTLLLASDGRIVGLLGLQDGLRTGARAAVQRLHDARIEPVMLSGEARETCEALARALDIDHVRAEVAAGERSAEVRALREGGDVVAVLGHPAADESALSAADVSVALDSVGATAGDWAVALASDDPRDAVAALTSARDAVDRARRALVIGWTPGVAAALGLALGLFPAWTGPAAALVGATAALLYARDA